MTTDKQAQRTPGPWTVGPRENFEDRMPRILSDGGRYNVLGLTGNETPSLNAAFIVQACNSHDDLIAALRAFVYRIDRAELVPARDGKQYADDLLDDVVAARAAIARAEGQS